MRTLTPPSAPVPRARIDGLDGLRALAVVGVLLYHAEVPWAQGGFVGVDVFFVLSGYLVTTMVLSAFERSGGLGFRRFWSARIRRLAPAQIAVIVAVTVVMAIGFRDDLAGLRGQVLAALTGTTNWYLIVTQGSYFEQLGRAPVLRHLWSLAVEIQFYLLFPPLLIVLLRWGRDRLDRIVLVLVGAIAASTVYMAVLFHPGTDPTRPYFDTFARLAAPLVGAVLALVWRPRHLRRGPAHQLGGPTSLAGAVGLVGLLWTMHVADDRSAIMYRGGFLLVAVLSAVIVAGATHPTGRLGGPTGLGNPVLVTIGLRSYGLYLWHWPVFVLLRPRIDVDWPWGVVFVVRILLTVVLTELCYRFVERPWHLRARDASFAGIKRRILAPRGVTTGQRLAALSSVGLAMIAIVVLAVPHKPQDDIAESLRAGEAALANKGRPAGAESPTTLPTGKPDTTSSVTVVGDSVTLGSAPAIFDAFGQRANIDAKVGRQAADLGPAIQQLDEQQRLGTVLVVQVGINGTVTEDDLSAIVKAAGGRRTLIVNARVPRPWEASNNALVARVVPSLDNAEIIDWYTVSNGHLDWFLDDGVHLTEGGRAIYATTLLKAVNSAPAPIHT